MRQKHPDAAALERLGYPAIKSRMNVTRQTFRNWKADGVPNIHRKNLVNLGAVKGIPMTELERDRDSATNEGQPK